MEYRKYGDSWIVRIDRGEEVVESLTELCRREDIRLAEVNGLGAVDHAMVCVYDVPSKQFYRRELDGPMEISGLTGTVTRKDGQPYLHLHATLCDRELRAWGGHVNALRVAATCELVLRTLPGEVGRKYDREVGLNLLEF